VSSYPNYLIC